MENTKKNLVTKEFYDGLVAEQRRIIDVDRPQLLEELAFARQQGDLSENADYSAAREKQAEMEARLREIESILNNSEIIKESKSKNKVAATSVVTVFDTDEQMEIVYTLIGSMGSIDPEHGKITTESPLGSALLGKEVGDEVEVICGDGSSYTVIIRKIA